VSELPGAIPVPEVVNWQLALALAAAVRRLPAVQLFRVNPDGTDIVIPVMAYEFVEGFVTLIEIDVAEP